MKNHILFLIFIIGFSFAAVGQEISEFAFDFTIGGLAITNYFGNARNVVIPERVNGLPVVVIAPNAFARKQLTSVIIPDTVVRIYFRAFENNRLTNIFLPDNVNIEPDSFDNLSVYYRYIESGRRAAVYTIDVSIYNDFEIAVIDNSVVEILKYNGNLRDVIIPEKIKGLPVVAIGNSAFSNKQLTSAVIPNFIVVIGNSAFRNNHLTIVVIPDSAISIRDWAFQNN